MHRSFAMINQSISVDERNALLPLIAASFFQVVDMMIVNPLGAWIVPELGLDTAQFSVLLSVYNLVSAAIGLMAAPLLDRFNRRSVLFSACLALALVTLLTASANGLIVLAVLRGMAGACGGVLASQALAMAGDLVAPQRRGQAIGFVMSSFGIASVVGVPLSLAVASKFGWRASFIGIGAAGLLISMFMLVLPSVQPSRMGIAIRDHLMACRANAGALFASGCLAASVFLIIPFISLYYVGHVGVQTSELSLIYVAGGLSAMLFMKRAGQWSDRFGASTVFFWLAALSLVPILTLTNLGNFGLPAAMVASILFFCLVAGRNVPLNALLVSSVPVNLRGGFMSVNVAGQSLATALGAVVGGFLSSLEGAVTGTFQINGMASAAMTSIAMIAVLKLRR